MSKLIYFLIVFMGALSACSDQSDPLKKKEFYANDSLKKSYSVDEEGKFHGKYLYYDENGNVETKSHYVHGKLEGKEYSYEKGELAIIQIFKNDALVEKQFFAKERKLELHEFYDDGSLLKSIHYHSNGNISSMFSKVVNSDRMNTYIYFDSNGNIVDKELSNYVLIESYSKNSISLKLPEEDNVDQVQIAVLSKLNDSSALDHLKFENIIANTITINLKDYFYSNESLLLNIRKISNNGNVRKVKSIFLQINEGEKIDKYNMNPIY